MKPQSSCSYKNNNCGITILGITTFSCGIILLFLKSWFLELLTTSLLVLKPNSLLEDVWRKIPDIPTDIYLFNWTNSEDFHNFSIRPKFEQVGPYRFMQDIEKVNAVWNDNNTVTYNQARHWHFDEEHTNEHLSKQITTINTLTLCFAHHIRHLNYFVRKISSVYLETSAPNVHITRTAKEFLIEGYDDFIIDMGNHLPSISPEIPRFDKFGLMGVVNKSKTLEGILNIANGIDGSFEVRNWNFYNKTPYFDSPCAKVHGSAGELFSSKLSKDYIGIFVSGICRYVRLDFEKEVVVDGLLGYKYSLGNGVLDTLVSYVATLLQSPPPR